MVMEDRVVTYSMLKVGIERCARRIAALHIDRRATVAVLIKNPIRHVTISLALLRLSLLSISLEHGQAGIVDLKFGAVLGDKDAVPLINRGNPFFEVDDEWFELDPPTDSLPLMAFSDPTQVCRLSLTSGSTGAPKFIEHTIAEFSARMIRQHIDLNWTRLLCLPGLSSNWGFSTSCAALASGRTVCFAQSQFQAVRMIELFGVDLITASMEQVLALARVAYVTGAQLDSLRTIWLGGGVPTRALLEGTMKYLCNNILCRYAASETGVLADATAREVMTSPGLVGRILPGIKLGIFDQAGQECPIEKVGVVKVRADSIDPSLSPGQSERWIDLGDIGWINSQNQLYVLGRVADVGWSSTDLSPVHEIEHHLRLECDFSDAAVVLNDGSSAGETRQIWVGVVNAKDLTVEKLAAILRPRGFDGYTIKLFPLAAVPRGLNGKVNRQQLNTLMLDLAR